MIQDIFPSKLDNSFKDYTARDEDILIVFDTDGKAVVAEKDGRMAFRTCAGVSAEDTVYLFSIDETRYFLYVGTADMPVGAAVYTIREIRDRFSGKDDTNIFAVFTAYHLWRWYADNKFCGRCGRQLTYGKTERSLVCEACGNTAYPRINPAVIVGVINKDSLLLTKYRRGYAHNALVAGFTEIGETLEETVAREVFEETGLKVKNITYYKSQPWGMAQDILVGYYCEVDGDSDIHMDESELKYAEWVKREDIVLQPNNLSLTNEMMRMFKDGKWSF
jgi:NAD+ diphosphatase